MFKEPLSPNVSYIAPSPWRFRADVSKGLARMFNEPSVSCTIHRIDNKPAIFEIDLGLWGGARQMVTEGARGYFKEYADAGHLYPVSVTGLKEGTDKGIGSHRFCTNDPSLAVRLTEIVNGLEIFGDFNHADHGAMELVGVSKYFRFMQYKTGGEHFPHFDSDFEFPAVENGFGFIVNEPDHFTTHTLVMYMSDNETGEIAFIKNVPADQEPLADWTRQATEEEIILKVKPKVGKIVIFDHSICHTVLPFNPEKNDELRMIARGDLIYRKV